MPGDVSVVGFDDIFGADFCSPTLTTLAERTEDAGARAVEAVVHQALVRAVEPPTRVLPTRLVVRLDRSGAELASGAGAPVGWALHDVVPAARGAGGVLIAAPVNTQRIDGRTGSGGGTPTRPPGTAPQRQAETP